MKLSVVVFSYNHQDYIEKCMDSIFAQQTDFDYEVILADDCSSDRTREIVRNKYGDKVCILYREHNLGLCRNMYEAFSRANGKYIYECSGDDYLLTDHVFARHIDFLEKNQNYYSVFNYIKTVNAATKAEKISIPPYDHYSLTDFLKGTPVHFYIGTMRNTFKQDDPVYLCQAGRNNEEIQMIYYTLSKGDKAILPEALYAYNLHFSGNNYCSTHTWLDILRDYAEGFRVVEKIDAKRHNFHIAKVQYYSRYIDKILESKNSSYIFGIFRILNCKELLSWFWIKSLMKFNHGKIPTFLLRKSELV